jgi:hypothetical protein
MTLYVKSDFTDSLSNDIKDVVAMDNNGLARQALKLQNRRLFSFKLTCMSSVRVKVVVIAGTDVGMRAPIAFEWNGSNKALRYLIWLSLAHYSLR